MSLLTLSHSRFSVPTIFSQSYLCFIMRALFTADWNLAIHSAHYTRSYQDLILSELVSFIASTQFHPRRFLFVIMSLIPFHTSSLGVDPILNIVKDYCLFKQYSTSVRNPSFLHHPILTLSVTEHCHIDGGTPHDNRISAIDEYN
jgi:hypothetical protein